jgi:general secretion pathway protein A
VYNQFYQLKEDPFNVTSDPDFFFSSRHHAEAFSHLIYGIQQRKGIMVVTGEIGTGKTTLCRMLLNRLDDQIKTALILNPQFSQTQLLHLILKDLGVESRPRSKLALTEALNQFLLEQSSQGHNVVLIIDEAQNLDVRQLEQIRLLSNLETEKTKLLQIVLVGQPELLDKLKLNSLRQLNQRITVRYHLLPLTKEEIHNYILHRINVASLSPESEPAVTFTREATETIFNLSRGTPRLINILCDRALLSGFVKEIHIITEKIIVQCAREVPKL